MFMTIVAFIFAVIIITECLLRVKHSAVCFTEVLAIICEDRTSPSCSYSSLPCMGTEISVTSVDSHLPAPLVASVEVAFFSFGELGRRNCSGVAQSCCFLFLLKGDAHPVRLCSLLP